MEGGGSQTDKTDRDRLDIQTDRQDKTDRDRLDIQRDRQGADRQTDTDNT